MPNRSGGVTAAITNEADRHRDHVDPLNELAHIEVTLPEQETS